MRRGIVRLTGMCVCCDHRWVFEEYVKLEDGKWVRPARGAKPPEGKTWVDEGYSPLTKVINEKHENVRDAPHPFPWRALRRVQAPSTQRRARARAPSLAWRGLGAGTDRAAVCRARR